MTQEHDSPPAGISRTTKGRFLVWGIYIGLILCISFLALAALLKVPHGSLPVFLDSVRKASNIGTICQFGVALWIVMSWKHLIAWGRLKGIVKKNEHRKVIALRTKVGFAMTLYLMLFPIGPIPLWRFIQSLIN